MLPADIQTLVSEAKEALKKHPNNRLTPYYRQTLYAGLRAKSGDDGAKVQGWWALYAGLHVKDAWTAEYGDHCKNMLDLAEQVLMGQVSDAIAEDRLAKSLHELEAEGRWMTGNDPDSYEPTTGYYCDMHRVVLEAMGKNPLEGVILTPDDVALDDYAQDTAGDACNSYCFVDFDFDEQDWVVDLDKRLAFWIWWLDEALPQAWQKVK